MTTYKFCRKSCQDRFEKDLKDGMIVNEPSLKILNRHCCPHCFDELKVSKIREAAVSGSKVNLTLVP